MLFRSKTVEEKNSWKRDLFHRLNIIRATCGDLCSITDEDTYLAKVIPVPNGAFPRIEANVDCDAIIGNADIDACDPTVPYPPPKELMPFYTLDGMIHFNEFKKLQNTYLGKLDKPDGQVFDNQHVRLAAKGEQNAKRQRKGDGGDTDSDGEQKAAKIT